MPGGFRRGQRAKRLEPAPVLGMGALYFCSQFHRVAVPNTVFNGMQQDLALSASSVTALSVIFLYILAGTELFAGIAAVPDVW